MSGGNGNGNGRTKEKLKVWVPTEKFKAWADLRLDPERPMGTFKACEEAGVKYSTIYYHLQKPEAIEYLNRRREQMFRQYAPAIDAALMAKCMKGDIAAIRLFHELYGDLKQAGSGNVTVVIPKELASVGSN